MLSDFGNFVFHPPLALVRPTVLLEPVRIVHHYGPAPLPRDTRSTCPSADSRIVHQHTPYRQQERRIVLGQRARPAPARPTQPTPWHGAELLPLRLGRFGGPRRPGRWLCGTTPAPGWAGW